MACGRIPRPPALSSHSLLPSRDCLSPPPRLRAPVTWTEPIPPHTTSSLLTSFGGGGRPRVQLLGSQFPESGLNLYPLQQQHRVLAIRPPGNPLYVHLSHICRDSVTLNGHSHRSWDEDLNSSSEDTVTPQNRDHHPCSSPVFFGLLMTFTEAKRFCPERHFLITDRGIFAATNTCDQ